MAFPLTVDLGRRAAVLALRRLHGGRLVLREGESVTVFGSGAPDGLVADVQINDPRAYLALVAGGSVGLGTSYAQGWWSCDDLAAVLRLGARNLDVFDRLRGRWHRIAGPVLDPLRRMRRPDTDRDRDNIAAHYDTGNDFFELILDPTMTYSCALFDHPDMTLEDASFAKLDRLCQLLDLRPGDRVLEIGGGWGSFALHAAGHYGASVTTTTISGAQRTYAADRVERAGLESMVTVLGAHYRELTGTYDKLVSIEMIEAVDWRELDDFWATCCRLLEPDGLLALQAIVVADQRYEHAKSGRDYVRNVVFPGGCLPSVSAISRATATVTDFALVDLVDIGEHYAETVRRWSAALDENAAALEGIGHDAGSRRRWAFYFAACEAVFAERRVSAVQALYARAGWRPVRARSTSRRDRRAPMLAASDRDGETAW